MEGLKSLFSLKIYNTFLNPDVVNFIEKNGYRFLGSASAFSNGKMIDCNQLRVKRTYVFINRMFSQWFLEVC